MTMSTDAKDVEPLTKKSNTNKTIDQKLQELCERMEELMTMANLLHEEYVTLINNND